MFDGHFLHQRPTLAGVEGIEAGVFRSGHRDAFQGRTGSRAKGITYVLSTSVTFNLDLAAHRSVGSALTFCIGKIQDVTDEPLRRLRRGQVSIQTALEQIRDKPLRMTSLYISISTSRPCTLTSCVETGSSLTRCRRSCVGFVTTTDQTKLATGA